MAPHLGVIILLSAVEVFFFHVFSSGGSGEQLVAPSFHCLKGLFWLLQLCSSCACLCHMRSGLLEWFDEDLLLWMWYSRVWPLLRFNTIYFIVYVNIMMSRLGEALDWNFERNQKKQNTICVIGWGEETYDEGVERRTLDKMMSITENQDHRLYHTLERQLCCLKDCLRRSFRLRAVTLQDSPNPPLCGRSILVSSSGLNGKFLSICCI